MMKMHHSDLDRSWRCDGVTISFVSRTQTHNSIFDICNDTTQTDRRSQEIARSCIDCFGIGRGLVLISDLVIISAASAD